MKTPRRFWRRPTWWVPIVVVVAYLLVTHGLEIVARKAPGPAEDGTTPQQAESAAQPTPPEVRWLEDGAIEIRHDFFRRTTIRLSSEKDQKDLLECLEEGFEQRFADGAREWSSARVRRESQAVQDKCLGDTVDLPVIPAE